MFSYVSMCMIFVHSGDAYHMSSEKIVALLSQLLSSVQKVKHEKTNKEQNLHLMFFTCKTSFEDQKDKKI